MMSNEEFQELYLENLDFSKRVAERIVRNPVVSEDVVQDVFVSLYKRREKLQPEEKERLHGLIFRATVNKSYDYMKMGCKRAKIYSLEDEEEEEIYASDQTVEGSVLERERHQHLGEALQSLRQSNETNYRIYTKIKLLDIPPELVAKEYGITTNNVNNRVRRTKLWLKKEYRKLDEQ
ncbi:MAG: sigma-70 family RNA polymerase sigma factor [Eubacteriales bacterium]|nr:sigma-70 family RNA polymerase sigma factor [Eubacteriales bacterium]